ASGPSGSAGGTVARADFGGAGLVGALSSLSTGEGASATRSGAGVALGLDFGAGLAVVLDAALVADLALVTAFVLAASPAVWARAAPPAIVTATPAATTSGVRHAQAHASRLAPQFPKPMIR